MKTRASERAYRHPVLRPLIGLALAGLVAGCALIGSAGDEGDKPSAATLEKKAGALSATSGAPASAPQQRVTRALNTIYSGSATPHGLTYYSKFIDLNGDGHDEAVAFVVGPDRCVDGCDLYVLRPEGKRYQVINRIPTSRVPVYALAHRSHGWRDLLVTTGGGVGGSNQQLMQYANGRYGPVAHEPTEDAKRTPLISSFDSHGHALHPKRDTDSDEMQ